MSSNPSNDIIGSGYIYVYSSTNITRQGRINSRNFLSQALLQIVEKKLNGRVLDLTLKFALSALWNLTDESPSTCGNFIQNNGLALVVRVLEVRYGSNG